MLSAEPTQIGVRYVLIVSEEKWISCVGIPQVGPLVIELKSGYPSIQAVSSVCAWDAQSIRWRVGAKVTADVNVCGAQPKSRISSVRVDQHPRRELITSPKPHALNPAGAVAELPAASSISSGRPQPGWIENQRRRNAIAPKHHGFLARHVIDFIS